MRVSLTLTTVAQARTDLVKVWALIVDALKAGKRLVLSVRTETRTIAQNSIMWSCLEDIAKQVQFVVDGRLQYVSKEDVKDILSASLSRQNRMALGIDGGVVLLGQHTSQMTIPEMCDMVTLCHAFGDTKGVQWRRTSLGRDVPDEVCAPRLAAPKPEQREEVPA